MDKLILPRIVLTGASGWIGRSILHQLQMYLSPKQFLERVIPLSSTKKSLKSTGYFGEPYDFCTYPLFEIKKNFFNKKPFTFFGLGWDYSGSIDWKEGYLDERKIYGSLEYPGESMPIKFEGLLGNHEIESSDELAQAAQLILREIIMRRPE